MGDVMAYDANRKFRRTTIQMKQHPDPTGAARAMLAALEAMLNASKHQASRDLAIAAIAQAKAAGIVTEDQS